MTNGSEDRLDRIERLIEGIGQQQEINTRSIELLGTRVDSNAQATASNSGRIAEVDRTLAVIGRQNFAFYTY